MFGRFVQPPASKLSGTILVEREGMDKRKKIRKANERKGKVKRAKDEEVNGQGERGVPRPHTGETTVAWR